VIQFLGVAEADQPRRHPVRQRNDVLPDVLAGSQLRLDLPEVSVIAVNVFGIVRRDAGGGGEGFQRRIALGLVVVVEVERPVGPIDLLFRGRKIFRRRRFSGLAIRRRAGTAGAARGQQSGEA
jgi:hypothetical protein